MKQREPQLEPIDIEFNGQATYVWRKERALENERAHKVDIGSAVRALEDPLVFVTEVVEGEYEAIGLCAGWLLAVRYELEDARIRILSAWRAIPTEEALYGR